MIDEKKTEQIAKLARLKLTPDEIKDFSAQLSKAVQLFEHISEVNTHGILPMVSPIETEIILREDVVNQQVTSEEILNNAPQRTGNLFTVPPVV